MAVKNKVQLITYPDSLGGNLENLNKVLLKHFKDIFEGGVHILPPFPSSGDRGFAPINYFEIEKNFGTYEDIKEIGTKFDVLVDLMVNHISRKSPYFQDFLQNGKQSEYADMFLTMDKLWEDGIPKQQDIDRIFRRRQVPYSTFKVGNEQQEQSVWTTFGKTTPSEQIDLDIYSDKTREFYKDLFMHFSKNNIKIVRLDAVGYVIKKMGTDCFFVEPEIYDYLKWIKELADEVNIELLPEVHAHYEIQYKLAEHGYWIYDFILPYLVLETLINKDSENLYKYLKVRPEKQFTMLDCHDGIPVKPDLDDIYDKDKVKNVIAACEKQGANFSRIISDDKKSEDGFDVHQINCTYYSALDCNDNAYIAARAIQLFVPGIPQVYYEGALAGVNHIEAVAEEKDGRAINRYNYSLEEIEEKMESPVVNRLMGLIKFRNNYEAFGGKFTFDNNSNESVILEWTNGDKNCKLNINLNTFKSEVEYIDLQGKTNIINI